MPDPSKATMDWFRTMWPVVGMIIMLALGGLKAWSMQNEKIAVLQTKSANYEEDMREVKQSLKDIQTFLMNMVR